MRQAGQPRGDNLGTFGDKDSRKGGGGDIQGWVIGVKPLGWEKAVGSREGKLRHGSAGAGAERNNGGGTGGQGCPQARGGVWGCQWVALGGVRRGGCGGNPSGVEMWYLLAGTERERGLG